MTRTVLRIPALLALALAACDDGIPFADMGGADMATASPDLAGADMAGADMTGGSPDMAVAPTFDRCPPAHTTETAGQCAPAATDYTPRDAMSANDTWAACVSDNNAYTPFDANNMGAAARIMAFESMAARLWRNASTPTSNDFLMARNDYSIANGLGSRVERRQDLHYDVVPGGNKFACQTTGIPDQYPDRCAGPARLVPILNDAFAKGISGDKPLVQSARIEASLLWFLYLSSLSEMWTSSFDKIGDLDSARGYYDGGGGRAAPLGIGKYLQTLEPATHDRAFDGVLAARCWRDLDEAFPATDPALYCRASNQFDKAALRGLAVIAKDRLAKLGALTGEAQEAQHELIKLLVGWLDRESRARDAAQADSLKAEVAKASAQVDATAARATLDALYPCP